MNEIYTSSKKKFKTVFEMLVKTNDSYELGEAALPAYAHKNPMIDWLFWKRIQIAYNHANNTKKAKNKILDFGCGSGVLSYMLAQNNHDVIACDIEFSPLNLVKKSIKFPSNIHFVEGNILHKNLESNSFDIIYALDVLEHIDDLEPYIKLFDQLLTPDGLILVSGPTENSLYKLGRKLAGNRFTGDYHVTNITKIKKAFSPYLEVSSLRKLLFPVVLFELFEAQKKTTTPV
ncbi:class I SAM-dependent methyltransferase [Flavobacteriaceae bacterium S356]|uniref:Class I SAM-dependent methyltransferase n=1 Tax=Asprobacillus argus TaxID=3076534 RepID=A0ABU3LD62_9FLAO|nr:class I SAM-dependent methyltransferase [Flavobacteriaceae bacterium S356]